MSELTKIMFNQDRFAISHICLFLRFLIFFFIFYFIFFLKHILIEKNQKALKPMCDHYQYSRKVKRPEERQVQSINFSKYIYKKKNLSKKGVEVSIEEI